MIRDDFESDTQYMYYLAEKYPDEFDEILELAKPHERPANLVKMFRDSKFYQSLEDGEARDVQ